MATTFTNAYASLNNIGSTILDQSFKITGRMENIVIDQAVDYIFEENAKTISFNTYNSLSAVTTALTGNVDPDATSVTDAKVDLTPAEFGNVCTYTSLAEIGSGGKASVALGQLVGQNLVDSSNAIAFKAVKDNSDVVSVFGGDATADGSIDDVPTNSVQYADLQELHNKLLNNAMPFEGDYYYLYVHPHVAGDLAKLSEFKGASQISSLYANTEMGQMMTMANMVGTIAGFKVIVSKECTLDANAGSGNIDVYESVAVGKQGLGKAMSLAPELRITTGTDSLSRMVHVGWYGIFTYGVIDPLCVVKYRTASSYGANS